MTTQKHVVSGSGSKCFGRRTESSMSNAAKRLSKMRTGTGFGNMEAIMTLARAILVEWCRVENLMGVG